MRVEEAVLFLAVVALSLALVIVVVAPILLQKRRASRTAADGTPDLAVQATAAACPACHRHQPADFRFCPFDGTPLGIRLPIEGERDTALQSQDVNGATLVATGGKICPSCSRRYRLDTAVCPRDGASLVAVN